MDTQVLLSFCKARQTLYPLLGIALIESDSSSYADYLFASPSFKERMDAGKETGSYSPSFDVYNRRSKAKKCQGSDSIHFFFQGASYERTRSYLSGNQDKDLYVAFIRRVNVNTNDPKYNNFIVSRNNNLSSLFEMVLIVNKKEDSYFVVHRNHVWGEEKAKPNFISRIADFTVAAIHPKDRDRFLLYRNPDFWKERTSSNPNGFVKDFFRVKSIRKEYRWREVYIIDRKEPDFYRLCVSYVNTPVEEMFLSSHYDNIATEDYVFDGLTGLRNRHGFERAESRIARKKEKKTFTLISIDIDNFKIINDLFGHAFGDEVLTKRAKDLRRVFGYQNLTSRTGGDEFTVLFTNQSYQDLEPSIKKFATRQHSVRHNGKNICFTVSIGVATYPDQASSLDELAKKSDRALYAVKRNGKKNYSLYSKDREKFTQSQIGFSFQDRHESYPGGRLFYPADRNDNEILHLNQERINLSGYDSLEDFRSKTEGSLSSLFDKADIRERKKESNKLVTIYRKAKSGDRIPLLIKTRKVHHPLFGDVFYAALLPVDR